MTDDFLERFRDPRTAASIARTLSGVVLSRPVTIMHVCGTHEHTIAREGIRSFLPDRLRLVAGPGCPVCVCPAGDIDLAVAAARLDGVIVTTFGDMFRVPATDGSLEEMRAAGRDVRVVYSPLDAVDLAREHPEREVVFMAVGFETTAGPIAASLLADPPNNFSIIPSLRLVPPVMRFLLERGTGPVEGFLLPGHVSTVLGRAGYRFLEEYGVPGTVAGFESTDVLLAVLDLVRAIEAGPPFRVTNLYSRVVSEDGNARAKETISRVFTEDDASWRGIGVIPRSGLRPGPGFERFDAVRRLGLVRPAHAVDVPPGCLCHRVILGDAEPEECGLFGTACTIRRPAGPCMVSSEGTCRARFEYRRARRGPEKR
ncbi:MAG: hydrogenase formation protein HypD [Candidatus Krumholzibacteriota bacterium]|nr:hydrogenase formation protein HypD [Candidatus Krumholzibacteriota bacterium]